MLRDLNNYVLLYCITNQNIIYINKNIYIIFDDVKYLIKITRITPALGNGEKQKSHDR